MFEVVEEEPDSFEIVIRSTDSPANVRIPRQAVGVLIDILNQVKRT